MLKKESEEISSKAIGNAVMAGLKRLTKLPGSGLPVSTWSWKI
jgi:hypothetical protein